MHFHHQAVFPSKKTWWLADLVQNTCILCTLFADLVHSFSEKVCIRNTLHTWPECASLQKSGMHTWHTFPLVCKVCTMFQTLTGESSETPSNPTPMRTQGIPVSSRSCASWITTSTAQWKTACELNAFMLHTVTMHTTCTPITLIAHKMHAVCILIRLNAHKIKLFVWAKSIKTFAHTKKLKSWIVQVNVQGLTTHT